MTNLQELHIINYDLSTPVSPIILQALPPHCSIIVLEGVFDKLMDAYEMSCSKEECKVPNVAWTYSFKRNMMNPYFDRLQNYPIGTIKLQMLVNKANQRAVATIYLPGGAKCGHLKMAWKEMQQEED